MKWQISLIFAALLAASPGNHAQGVLAYYTFDDGAVVDITGNGPDGLIFGDPVFEEGILGLALEFDGIDDRVVIPESASLNSTEVALSFWFRIEEIPSTSQVLLCKMEGETGYSAWIDGATGAVSFAVRQAGVGETMVAAGFPAFPEVWTSVVAIYSNDMLRLYIHGRLAAESPVDADINVSELCPIYFATDADGNQPFAGRLDDVRIGSGNISPQSVCATALKLWHPEAQVCLDSLVDVTAELGVGDPDHHHFGLAIVDFNDDGWVDIYWENGHGDPVEPQPWGECPELDPEPEYDPLGFNTAYLNNGDGTFTGNVAPEIGLDDPWNAMRHAWGDYDNDGMRDLISHNFIYSSLYRAVSHDPLLFENVNTGSGVEICVKHGTGASWVDMDNDGYLDLYVCEWDPVDGPELMINKVYQNNGDGTFTDISTESGLWEAFSTENDNPMGLAWADFDNDGDQDMFPANSPPAPTRLWRNDGVNENGVPQFTDIAAEAGVYVLDDLGLGFGAAWGDYNNDGYLDLLFTRELDSRLYRNNGPSGDGDWSFTDVTSQIGISNLGNYHDGVIADINNDGWMDMLLASASSTTQELGANRVFLNNGDPDANGDVTWLEIAGVSGVEMRLSLSRGIVPADYDNNGTLDIFVWDRLLGNPNRVIRNDARGRNWIQFNLIGTASNRDAVGARIYITSILKPGEAPVTQLREVIAGTGFFSDMPRIQTFGLDMAAEVQEVSIHWPSGQVQQVGTLEINMRHTIVEPGLTDFDDDQENPEAPSTVHLAQNYPNPFNPSTTLEFGVRNSGRVTLKVYDITGRFVTTLVDRKMDAGNHAVEWDGTDHSGEAVASGIYLYRMRAGEFVETRQMLLMK